MYAYRHRFGGFAAGLLACLACGRGWAEDAPRSGDEAAIRQRAKDYLEAITRGDGDEIASFWTAEGDYIDETGQTVNGCRLARQAARKRDDRLKPQAYAHTGSLRFVTPDVVIEDATISIDPVPLERTLTRRFTAIWTRRDGKWLLDGVRELAAPAISHHDHLGGLSWMLGKWISDDDGKRLRVTCTWSEDEQFLIREIDIKLEDGGELHDSAHRLGRPRETDQVVVVRFAGGPRLRSVVRKAGPLDHRSRKCASGRRPVDGHEHLFPGRSGRLRLGSDQRGDQRRTCAGSLGANGSAERERVTNE